MGGASRFIMLLTTPFPPLLHRPSSLIFLRPHTRSLSTSTTRHLTLSSPSTGAHHRLLFPTTKSFHRKLHAQPLNSPTISPYQAAADAAHPWPEWSHLINTILSSSQEKLSLAVDDHGINPEDAFVVCEENKLSEEFIRCASLCLAFSRSHPNLLGLLSRRDIEVIVTNGTPFLFKTALDNARRMRAYLGMEAGNVLESDKANMVDIMKYILSYANNPSVSSEQRNSYGRELIESSVRNLLCQITEISFRDPAMEDRAPEQYRSDGGIEQTARAFRQNVEMKRGDWICPKCSFMNFARNFKCLECEEPRPQKLLTGREWQCPQCNFLNYGRNLVCLRCDCKRPGIVAANNVQSMSELGNLDVRFAENEEKAKCWFSKVSQPDNASVINNAAVDEDFPEIMPLRKGENRFVVSTRKTPLERRQANFQHQSHMDNYGVSEGGLSESPGHNTGLDSSIRRSLDQILGNSSAVSRTDDQSIVTGENIGTDSSASLPESGSVAGKAAEEEDIFSKRENQTDSRHKVKEQAEKSEKWFQRVAELHNVRDLPSAISDEDFPELMPMRKGENRFVVSKKKDRSLTSPAYKRQVAAEQPSNSKFVPFVPFPPGYFARKDTPASDDVNSTRKPFSETSSSSSTKIKNSTQKPDEVKHMAAQENSVQETRSQVRTSEVRSTKFSGDRGTVLGGNSSQNSFASQTLKGEIESSECSREKNTFRMMNSGGGSEQLPNQNVRPGWSGKSLEGSAVKEPDPLDMSEEAKTERWFRRVAQIKDISELSQIPDEDFPSIMPMRKGVNRFVVSKRKTPLERRLTSPQNRRNLPTVNSDPVKNDSGNNEREN